jgi:acetyl esterase/lipase
MNNLRTRGRRAGYAATAVILLATIFLPAAAGATHDPNATTASLGANAAATAQTAPAASLAPAEPASTALAQSIDALGVLASGGLGGASDSLMAAIQPTTPARLPDAPIAAPYGASSPAEIQNVPYTQLVDCGGYKCQLPLDVYVPSGPGPYPTVVLLRGGPGGIGGRIYLDSFATSLAATGLLVFSIDVRDLASGGGGYPEAMQDAACGIRFARAESTKYGGDGGPVTLIGHSFGSYIGAVLALNPVEYEGGCLYDGLGRPDAFVGFAGCYDVTGGGNATDFANFFGGYPSTTANLRAAGNPFNYANGSAIPVRLVAGTADGTVNPVASADLNSFLSARGWNVSFSFVPDETHMSVLWTTEGRQAVFGAIALAKADAETIDPIEGRFGS